MYLDTEVSTCLKRGLTSIPSGRGLLVTSLLSSSAEGDMGGVCDQDGYEIDSLDLRRVKVRCHSGGSQLFLGALHLATLAAADDSKCYQLVPGRYIELRLGITRGTARGRVATPSRRRLRLVA